MDAIDMCSEHRRLLEVQMNEFTSSYEGDQRELIEALAEKIIHMCIYIGSPSSVKPMLQSIVNGKKKTWGVLTGKGVRNRYNDGNVVKVNPYLHPQCKTKMYSAHNMWGSSNDHSEGNLITGHFRWNWQAYNVHRDTRDYINEFFFTK